MQKQHEHNLSNQADECRLRIAQRYSESIHTLEPYHYIPSY